MAGNTKNLVRDAGNLPAPQYYNPTTDAYEYVHGANGGLNVNNYVMTAAGVWVPQKGTDNGETLMQLTGSNAQLLREDLESTALLGLESYYTRRWGAINGSTIAQIKPLDVSNYREKMIRVVNDHDVRIIVRFEAHKLITGHSPIYMSREWDVGAGSSVLISSADDPLLACPIIGLVAVLTTAAPVQTGTVSVEFYAGGVF